MWVTFLQCLFVFLGPVGPHRQGHKSSSGTEEAEEMDHCDIFLLPKVISRRNCERVSERHAFGLDYTSVHQKEKQGFIRLVLSSVT